MYMSTIIRTSIIHCPVFHWAEQSTKCYPLFEWLCFICYFVLINQYMNSWTLPVNYSALTGTGTVPIVIIGNYWIIVSKNGQGSIEYSCIFCYSNSTTDLNHQPGEKNVCINNILLKIQNIFIFLSRSCKFMSLNKCLLLHLQITYNFIHPTSGACFF